jgi:hypothetical protein
MSSAPAKSSSQKPEWEIILRDHLKEDFNSTKSVFIHKIKGPKHFMIMGLLNALKTEINNFNPTFLWENATKSDLEAVRTWILTSDNMIKKCHESLIMALKTIEICVEKIDNNP